MTCELLKLCLRMFVRHSLENENDTKADWLHLADKLHCEEAWKEIHYIAEQVKTHDGKHSSKTQLKSCTIKRIYLILQHI